MGKDDYRQAALAWFLRFVTIDLDALSGLEFDRFLLEAEHNFRPRLPVPGGAGRLDFGGWRRGASAWWPEKIKGAENWRAVLLSVQVELRGFLEREFFDGDQGSFSGLGIQAEVLFGIFDGAGVLALQPRAPRPLTVDGLATCAKLNLALLLAGIPQAAVKKCEFCGTYFANLTARVKIYCGQPCAARAATRASRERDPEAYNKRQREYMKRRYRERVGRKSGKRVKAGR